MHDGDLVEEGWFFYARALLNLISGHGCCVVTASFIFFLDVAELGRVLEMDSCFIFP